MVEEIDQNKQIYIKSLPGEVEKYRNSLTTILYRVSEQTKIPIESLKSRGRHHETADARFVYFRRARECTKNSLTRIGWLVNRDHATVLHGIKEANNTRQVVKLYEECFGKDEVKS